MRSLLFVGVFAIAVPKGHPSAGCGERLDPPRGRIGIVGHEEPWLGVEVDQVGVGTPADGRIAPGEVIHAVDGLPVWTFEDLKRRARGEPGTEVELLVGSWEGSRTVRLERAVFSDAVPRRTRELAPQP